MAFIDEVQLHIKAGDGGDGVVRWRSEKFKPKAGPGGGNGGSGGAVYAQVVDDLSYLEYYKFTKKFAAENGIPGGSLGQEGANGKPLTLRFPRGTVLTNLETEEQFELNEIGESVMILKGGGGGLGNEHFKSSTNTTPMEWTPGKPGGEADFDVELRLFADLGFLGLPSAGKSTLLNVLTNAKSKVGAYHFTTLEPHLGALGPFVLADIPGIIEGASEGKGLGHKFLRHVKRTKQLLHLVSADSEDPVSDYRVIRGEVEKYDSELGEKSEMILITKIDMVDEKTLKKVIEDIKKASGQKEILTLSAYDDALIKELKEILMKKLEA